MIKKATVRRARMTGYQRKNRKIKGDVFLHRKWIGQKVMVLTIKEYVDFKRELRAALIKIKKIKRLTDEYSCA